MASGMYGRGYRSLLLRVSRFPSVAVFAQSKAVERVDGCLRLTSAFPELRLLPVSPSIWQVRRE